MPDPNAPQPIEVPPGITPEMVDAEVARRAQEADAARARLEAAHEDAGQPLLGVNVAATFQPVQGSYAVQEVSVNGQKQVCLVLATQSTVMGLYLTPDATRGLIEQLQAKVGGIIVPSPVIHGILP